MTPEFWSEDTVFAANCFGETKFIRIIAELVCISYNSREIMTMGSKSGKAAISPWCGNILNSLRWGNFFADAFFDCILIPTQKSSLNDGIWDVSFLSLKFSPNQMDENDSIKCEKRNKICKKHAKWFSVEKSVDFVPGNRLLFRGETDRHSKNPGKAVGSRNSLSFSQCITDFCRQRRKKQHPTTKVLRTEICQVYDSVAFVPRLLQIGLVTIVLGFSKGFYTGFQELEHEVLLQTLMGQNTMLRSIIDIAHFLRQLH